MWADESELCNMAKEYTKLLRSIKHYFNHISLFRPFSFSQFLYCLWKKLTMFLTPLFPCAGSQNLEISPVNLKKICYLPKVVGPCRARIPRYFYNKCTKRCELFYYGGCHGNKNNFHSLKKCNRVCATVSNSHFWPTF